MVKVPERSWNPVTEPDDRRCIKGPVDKRSGATAAWLADAAVAEGETGDVRPHPDTAASPRTSNPVPKCERTRAFMCPPFRQCIGRSLLLAQTHADSFLREYTTA